MKRIALCIHDLRASEGEKIIRTINNVREYFEAEKVTVNLVIDKDLSGDDKTFRYLKEEVEKKRLEIVFHGISHQCPAGTWKLFSWYHKNQAEFLSDIFQAETNRFRYNKLNEILQIRTGICPPCWIASQAGWKFIKSLSPLYFEKLLSVNFNGKGFFSLPVSLASDNKNELYFLKGVASLVSAVAILFHHKRLRLILHTIDIPNVDSITFLKHQYHILILKGFSPVLQKELT
ncbi:MAG: hypothetical protein ABSA76_09195 [Bacteroidales bacterium]